jgi:hypothetical protein
MSTGFNGMDVHIESLVFRGNPLVGPSGVTELGRYRGWHEIAGMRFRTIPLKIDKTAAFSTEPFRMMPVMTTLEGILGHIRDNVVPPLRLYF